MAITGKFEADFASFLSAVDQADAKLKSFEGDGAKVEKQLTRMGNSLSGTKLIQDAVLMAEAVDRIGGASKLTAEEMARVGSATAEAVAKMRALGVDVPAQLQRVADATHQVTQEAGFASETFGRLVAAFSAANLIDRGVSALASWTAEAARASNELVDMSGKTGLGIEFLQRMGFVAQQTSTDLASLTNAAFQLGQRIAGGQGSVRKAAEDLGLEWAALRALKPEEQWNAVVAAAEKMTEPQRRNNDLVALFGKTAQEVLPAIAAGYTHIAEQAKVAGEEQVKAVSEAANRWEAFKANLQTGFTGAAGDILLLRDAVGKLTQAQKDFILQTLPAGASIQQYDAALIAAARAADIVIPPTEKAAQVTRDYALELDKAVVAYDNLTPAQEDAIKAGDKLGATNDEIANSLGLEVETVVLAKKEFQAHEEQLKKDADAAKGTTKALADLDAEMKQLQVQQGGTPNEKAIAAIEDWKAKAIAAAVAAGTATTEFYDKIEAEAQLKLGAVGTDWTALGQVSLRVLRETADNAASTYEYALTHSSEFTKAAIDHFGDLARAARQAALHPGLADVNDALDAGAPKAEKLASWFDRMADSAKKAADAAQVISSVDYATPEGQRIANGQNAATQADYIRTLGVDAGIKAWDELQRAIESGRKAIEAAKSGSPVPPPGSNYAGASSTGPATSGPPILPPGVGVGSSGPSAPFVVELVLDGNVLARVVGDALMRQAKNGKLFPAGA